MTVSVVVVTYRRLARLGEILSAWLQQTSDVWLCDCSAEGFKTNLPIKLARFSPDPGNRVRHAVATLTAGDLVLKADDDILPLPGLVNDFIHWRGLLGPCVMSIHGRTFEGPDYYANTTLYAGHMLTEPKRVDFLGIITCSDRRFLPMDLRDCGTDIEDLYWHNFCYPDAPKFVIPTKHYNNKLPESRDTGRLCADSRGRAIRRAFYKRLWEGRYSG